MHEHQGFLRKYVFAYDHKVMQQSVLYGIPNYVVEGSSAQQVQAQQLQASFAAFAALAASPETDPASGLPASDVEFAPDGFDQDDTPDGTVFTTPGGGLEVENGRPVIPTLRRDAFAGVRSMLRRPSVRPAGSR